MGVPSLFVGQAVPSGGTVKRGELRDAEPLGSRPGLPGTYGLLGGRPFLKRKNLCLRDRARDGVFAGCVLGITLVIWGHTLGYPAGALLRPLRASIGGVPGSARAAQRGARPINAGLGT